MRLFITGDTHGLFTRIKHFTERFETTTDDVLIILGDVGLNYSGEHDKYLKASVSKYPITLFCIHGNHEKRPERVPGYEIITWNKGKVYRDIRYPNQLFAIDGEIYNLFGKKFIVIGGAYSPDKWYRLQCGKSWWADEQPSAEIKKYTEEQLTKVNWDIDYVLSHTSPYKYRPIEKFIPGVVDTDDSSEEWLDKIEDNLTYKHWYCGHFHTNKKVTSKFTILFTDILEVNL